MLHHCALSKTCTDHSKPTAIAPVIPAKNPAQNAAPRPKPAWTTADSAVKQATHKAALCPQKATSKSTTYTAAPAHSSNSGPSTAGTLRHSTTAAAAASHGQLHRQLTTPSCAKHCDKGRHAPALSTCTHSALTKDGRNRTYI